MNHNDIDEYITQLRAGVELVRDEVKKSIKKQAEKMKGYFDRKTGPDATRLLCVGEREYACSFHPRD